MKDSPTANRRLQRGHIGPDEDFGWVDLVVCAAFVAAVVGFAFLVHWGLQWIT